MFLSKLYKKYYPLKLGLDVFRLSQEEKSCLIHYIKHYPGHLSDKLLNARRSGIPVEGWERQQGFWKTRVFSSAGLVDVLIVLQQKCNDLIAQIEEERPLSDSDIANINRILYANKYCRPLSWFLCPTPDGRISANLE